MDEEAASNTTVCLLALYNFLLQEGSLAFCVWKFAYILRALPEMLLYSRLLECDSAKIQSAEAKLIPRLNFRDNGTGGTLFFSQWDFALFSWQHWQNEDEYIEIFLSRPIRNALQGCHWKNLRMFFTLSLPFCRRKFIFTFSCNF